MEFATGGAGSPGIVHETEFPASSGNKPPHEWDHWCQLFISGRPASAWCRTFEPAKEAVRFCILSHFRRESGPVHFAGR